MLQTKPSSGIQISQELVRVDNLCVGYRSGFPVVRDINFVLQTGKSYALVGGNGSGKTTLFRTLTSLQSPLSGKIHISKKIKSSYVPQAKKMALSFPLSVQDVLLMPKNYGFSFLPKKKFTDPEWILLERSGVSEYLKKQISECSGGQLQKVLILRALFTDADLVYLDEPMDSLDHKSHDLFQKILGEYLQSGNRSLFFITHNLNQDWDSGFDEIFEIDEGRFYNITKGERPPNCHHYD
ncbi:MAG: ATP-binding cassette domain-containing protein [Leptospira sp.]|nr:ATP-binding cassette domain-containing protein [Leptospira sp.]